MKNKGAKREKGNRRGGHEKEDQWRREKVRLGYLKRGLEYEEEKGSREEEEREEEEERGKRGRRSRGKGDIESRANEPESRP